MRIPRMKRMKRLLIHLLRSVLLVRSELLVFFGWCYVYVEDSLVNLASLKDSRLISSDWTLWYLSSYLLLKYILSNTWQGFLRLFFFKSRSLVSTFALFSLNILMFWNRWLATKICVDITTMACPIRYSSWKISAFFFFFLRNKRVYIFFCDVSITFGVKILAGVKEFVHLFFKFLCKHFFKDISVILYGCKVACNCLGGLRNLHFGPYEPLTILWTDAFHDLLFRDGLLGLSVRAYEILGKVVEIFHSPCFFLCRVHGLRKKIDY